MTVSVKTKAVVDTGNEHRNARETHMPGVPHCRLKEECTEQTAVEESLETMNHAATMVVQLFPWAGCSQPLCLRELSES